MKGNSHNKTNVTKSLHAGKNIFVRGLKQKYRSLLAKKIGDEL